MVTDPDSSDSDSSVIFYQSTRSQYSMSMDLVSGETHGSQDHGWLGTHVSKGTLGLSECHLLSAPGLSLGLALASKDCGATPFGTSWGTC
jgi:hypothetical protein